jgi:phosphodiesterase/alkaline phosphatase D-like protein
MFRVCLLALLAIPAAWQITHGPMLGQLTESSVTVWARTERPGEIRVRYGAALGELDRLSVPVRTTLEHDNTGFVALTGLEADQRYYY